MKLPLNLLIIFLLPIFFTITPVCSRFTFNNEYCIVENGNYTNESTYQENLNALLPKLVHKASSSIFNNHTVGQGIDTIYGLYLCRGDLDKQQCHDCVEVASLIIVGKCPIEREAIVWYDECMLRYANHDIFSFEEENYFSYTESLTNVSDPNEFGKIISEIMDGLIIQAAYNTSTKGYATDQANVTLFEELYLFAQCTPDILGSRCERCLRVAFRNMGACCGTARARMAMYLPSCWLRYSHAPFIGIFDGESEASMTPTTSASKPRSGSSSQNNSTTDFINNVANNLPSPRSTENSKATSTLGDIDFMLGLVLTLTTLLWTAW